MEKFFFVLTLALSLSISSAFCTQANADAACSALATTAGVYKKTNTSCEISSYPASYDFVQVAPMLQTELEQACSGMWISVASGPNPNQKSIGIGATNAPNDTYRCSSTDHSVSVIDCGIRADNVNCSYQLAEYVFTADGLTILQDGCEAHYLKIK